MGTTTRRTTNPAVSPLLIPIRQLGESPSTLQAPRGKQVLHVRLHCPTSVSKKTVVRRELINHTMADDETRSLILIAPGVACALSFRLGLRKLAPIKGGTE